MDHCFKGYHPWFSHWIKLEKVSKEQHYRKVLTRAANDPEEGDEEFQTLLATLPEPLLMDDLIDALRDDLVSFPNALLGEVGLDRSMKVPLRSDPNGRHLSRFKVSIAHQLQVLEKQVALAVELQRSISLHSVNCQAITIEFIDRMKDYHKQGWQDINLDLHSCGFSAETWTTIEVSSIHTMLKQPGF
jgi:Tat protein secretion system quality control protein TatD with DNase activity